MIDDRFVGQMIKLPSPAFGYLVAPVVNNRHGIATRVPAQEIDDVISKPWIVFSAGVGIMPYSPSGDGPAASVQIFRRLRLSGGA
jgi:hypothetical protein